MQKWITGMLLLVVFPVFLISENVRGQTGYEDLNLALKYRTENNIPMRYQVTKTGNDYTVFFSLDLPTGEDFNQFYELSFQIKETYGSQGNLITRTLNYASSGIGEEGSEKYFRFRIADAENFNILFLRLKNIQSTIEYVWDIPLRGQYSYDHPDFYLARTRVDLPHLYPYLEIGDAVQIIATDSSAGAYFVYHYNHTFSPADPPMFRLEKDVSRSMEVDTLFTVTPGEPFHLTKQGLYFIQSDTTSFAGISIRAEERFYPKLVRMEDIVDPVIYLTTSQEIEKLKKEEDQKKAFEKFWLNLASSEEMASKLIRTYFSQVENANRLFTNYKPGWKTDMGMIYIIYGPPDEVTSNGETESWYYNSQTGSEVVFNFLKLKSIFTHQHFLMVRDKQYRNSWYHAIERWRRGRINR
jgi:GWxTD domain-containing protein